jgi:hypothetical protein
MITVSGFPVLRTQLAAQAVLPGVAFVLTVWLCGLPAFWLSPRHGDYSTDLTCPHVVKAFRSGLMA